MGFNVNQLFAEVCGDEVFFAHLGKISSEQINSILEEIEGKFVDFSTSIKLRKKLYNIMVESLQNLFHHSDDVPEDLTETLGDRLGMIIIKMKGEEFRVTVGNFISSDKVKYLTEK